MANKGEYLPAEVYTEEEAERFFESFSKSLTGRRNRCMFLLAYQCQLRCAEICGLRVGDIDFGKKCITVINGKGRKRRVVGCSGGVLEEIKDYLEFRSLESHLVFVSHRGRKIDKSYMRKIAKAHGIKAKIKKRVHVHGWRHSGAVRLVDGGVPMHVIRRQLGHSSLAVTQRYIDHLTDSDVVEGVQVVEWNLVPAGSKKSNNQDDGKDCTPQYLGKNL